MSDETETQNQTGSSGTDVQQILSALGKYKWIISFVAIVIVVAMVGCTIGGA